MRNKFNPKADPNTPTVYQIRVKNHLDNQWTDWFSGMSITLEDDGVTVLTGPVADQAALHGLLKKVRDMGLPLVSVSQVQFNETHPYRSKKE
jgi:cobalamin biosynthesis Mg chelatase CobN